MYSISSTPTNLIDHEHLTYLVNAIADPDARAVVVGWGEYAKQLVNFHGSQIAAIYDPRPFFHGIKFRGVPVIDVPEDIHPINMILAGEYEFLYDYLPKVIDIYPSARHAVPSRMNYKSSSEINVFQQEALYKYLNLEDHAAPPTMMSKEKIHFLIELLRFGLTKPGIVVEMGSWQGGSTWYIAKVLSYLGETRKLFMMDLFEDHMMDPTATMCSDEIRRKMTIYDRVEMVQGLVDDPKCLEILANQPICFAHMDLGPQPEALDYLWDHLSPGSPLLLDNYGHLLAPPWGFERRIEAKGGRIIRLPWSEQGIAFKPA